jgi:rubrerythrin
MAMEEAALQRYSGLAVHMEMLGERRIAGTFLGLIEEERDHIEEIARRSRDLTGALPLARAADPRDLPAETARLWDEATVSATLTSYSALGVAVESEMQVFAFYSYIIAHSDDAIVRATAEWLARQALAHAAMLRKERRRAYHRDCAERARDPMMKLDAVSLADFERQSRRLESHAAAVHRGIAERLAALAEDAASATIAEIADREENEEAGLSASQPRVPLGGAQVVTPPLLLREALRQAEQLHNAYLRLAGRTRDEAVLAATQEAAARTMKSLSAIAAALRSVVTRSAPR